MATRFYFRDIIANDPEPTGKLSTDTDSFSTVPTNKNIPLIMTLDKGSAQTSVAGTYSTGSSPLYTLMRIFISAQPILAGTVLTGSQTITIGIGTQESHVNMNLYHRHFIYVMSSSLTNSKTILSPTSDPSEEGAGENWCLHGSGVFTSSSGNYTFAEGDRIVHEWWSDIRNTRNTNYTATIFFNGTDDAKTEGNSVTDAASYVEFTDNLQFEPYNKVCTNFGEYAIY